MNINSNFFRFFLALVSCEAASHRADARLANTGNPRVDGLPTATTNAVDWPREWEKTTPGSCQEPVAIGALRNRADSSRCVDPEGTEGGRANVRTNLCNAYEDQIFKFCEDGTIRSFKNGDCLDVRGYSGIGNVRISPCEVFPHVNQDQQWDVVELQDEQYEQSGVPQVLFNIKNRKSSKCLNIQGDNVGRGEIETYNCNDKDDQKFFILSRGGEPVSEGKLGHKDSGKCLSSEHDDGEGNLILADCADDEHQVFTLYKTGELVNDASQQCVDINDVNGRGNIAMYPCDGRDDQRWQTVLPEGDYFSLASMKRVSSSAYDVTRHCMNVKGDNVESHECNDVDYQKWTWMPKKWATAEVVWDPVFCNENGGIETTISTSVSSSHKITHSYALEITKTIKAGPVELSHKYTMSLSNTLGLASSHSTSITASCSKNEDGSKFMKGCLWQWSLSTKSLSLGSVRWQTGFTKCTETFDPPKCAPFMKCVDDECSHCQEDGEVTPSFVAQE